MTGDIAIASPQDEVAPHPRTRGFLTDVALNVGNRAAVLVLGLASSVVVARALGPSGRGTMAVAVTTAALLAQFGTLGFVASNPYFVARDPAVAARVVANAAWVAAVAGVVLAGIGIALKAGIPAVVGDVTWAPYAIALAGIPALLAQMFLQSVLLGEGRILAYNITEVVLAVLLLAALFVGLVVLDAGPTTAVGIAIGRSFAGALAYLALLRGRRLALARPDLSLLRQMLPYGLRVYMATLVGYLIIRADLVLVNAFRGTQQAGLYATAAALAEALFILPAAVALNLFPRIARGGGPALTARTFRSLAPPYFLLCCLSVPVAIFAVPLLYGDRFTGAVLLYALLAPGIFALGMLNVLSSHYSGIGFPRQAMLVWFAGLAVALTINLLFLPYGTWVASVASSVAYIVLLVLHIRLFGREAGSWRALLPDLRQGARTLRFRIRSLRGDRVVRDSDTVYADSEDP